MAVCIIGYEYVMVCLCSVMCVDAALDEPVLNWCVAMYRMYWSIGHVCAKVLFCHWIVLWCIVFVCGCIFLFLLLNYSDSTVFAYFQIELPMFGLFRVKSFYAFFLCEKYFLSITKYLNVIHVWQKKSLSNPSIIYIFLRFFIKCTVKWCNIHYLHFPKIGGPIANYCDPGLWSHPE